MLLPCPWAALQNPNTSYVKTEMSPCFLYYSVTSRFWKWTAAPIVRERAPLGAVLCLRHAAHLLGDPGPSLLSSVPRKGFYPTLPTQAEDTPICGGCHQDPGTHGGAVPIAGSSFLHCQPVHFVLALFQAMTLKRHMVGWEWKRWQLLHLAWSSFFFKDLLIHFGGRDRGRWRWADSTLSRELLPRIQGSWPNP